MGKNKIGQTTTKKIFLISLIAIGLLVSLYFIFAIPQVYDYNINETVNNKSFYNISYNYTCDDINGNCSTIFNYNGINSSIIDSYLLGWCNFDNRSSLEENDTKIVCWSPSGGFNGTVYSYGNINYTTTGYVNGGLQFRQNITSTRSYINFPYMLDNNTEHWSFSIMLYPEKDYSSTYYHSIFNLFGTWDGWLIYTNYSNCYYNIRNGTDQIVSAGGLCPTDEWTNIIGTRDGPYFTIYINGELIQNKTISGNILQSRSLNYNSFGSYSSYPEESWRRFNGTTDDYIISNRTWSSDEIKQFAYSEITKFDSQNYSFLYNNTDVLNTNKINSTNSSYNGSYYLCVSNSTGDTNCSENKVFTQEIPVEIISINFSEVKSTINPYFYGVDNNREFWFGDQGVKKIATSLTSNTLDSYSNTTWHKEKFLETNMGVVKNWISMSAYYTTIYYGGGANYWTNDSKVFSGSTTSGMPGVGIGVYGSGGSYIGNITKSSDAHTGLYSAYMANNGTSGMEVWGQYEAVLPTGSVYNISVWVKAPGAGNSSIIRLVGCKAVGGCAFVVCSATSTSSTDWEQIFCSYNNTESEYTSFRIDFAKIYGGRWILWDDFELKKDGEIYSWRYSDTDTDGGTSEMDKFKANNKFAYDNGKGIEIRFDDMPAAFANISYLCYNSTSTCPANNNTEFANRLADLIYIGTNNGEYLPNVIGVEDWNEAYLSGEWLSNDSSDSEIKSQLLNEQYDVVYDVLKERFPGIPVVGGNCYYGSPTMCVNFLEEFGNKTDGVTYHPYMNTYESQTAGMANTMNWLFDLCEEKGANCTLVLNTEWQPSSWTIKNGSLPEHRYRVNIAFAYEDMLNGGYSENISNYLFEWGWPHMYNSTDPVCTVDRVDGIHCYREWPQKYGIVSEPLMDNETNAPWVITKYFGHLCPGGGTIYETPGNDAISLVACSYNNIYSIIVINNLNESRAYILNLSGIYPYDSIVNFETGEIIELDESTIDIGVLDSPYIDEGNGGMLFLTSGESPTITFHSPTPANNSVVMKGSSANIIASISSPSGLNTSSILDFNKDLRCYLSMDYYNSTHILDNSSYKSNASLGGGGLSINNITNGIRGTSLLFDGVDDNMQYTVSQTGVFNNFTFGGFFRTNNSIQIDTEASSGTAGTGGEKYPVFPNYRGNPNSGAGLAVGNNGTIVYEHSDAYMPPLAVYNFENNTDWMCIVVVYLNKKPYIYLDGELVRTGITSPRTNVYAPTYLGGGVYGYYNGEIDEYFLSTKSWTASEVESFCNSKYNIINSTYTNLSYGQQNYTVYAIDEFGNSNTSSQRFFIGSPHIIIKKVGHFFLKVGSHFKLA